MNGGMYWQFGRDGNRCRTRYGNCRHYYKGYYYQTPWWTLPLIIGSTIANGNHVRSHVQWCLSRYRSYNPRTDMWLGNSGNRYRATAHIETRFYQCGLSAQSPSLSDWKIVPPPMTPNSEATLASEFGISSIIDISLMLRFF